MILYCAEIDEIIFQINYGFDGQRGLCYLAHNPGVFGDMYSEEILDMYHWEVIGLL